MSEKGVVHGSSDGGISAAHPVMGGFAASVAPSTSDGYNLLRSGSKPIACWRVDDLRFLFDSSFLSPHLSREIKHLWVLFENFRRKDTGEYPRLSVFGHADPSGDDDSNKLLSGRRAKALYALLLNGADPAGALSLWKEIAKAEKWGADHRALMQLETKVSKDAPDDLLFHAYLDWLSTVRSEDGVPAKGQDGQPIKLKVPASQFLGGGVDPKGKASYQGCSSFNPKLLFSQTDENRYQKAERENQHDVLEERNRANRPNRRVVVLLFRPGTKISPEKWPCPRADEGVAGCKNRFWFDGEHRRRHLPDSERTFEKEQDTFACRFYQRLTGDSPCERARVQCSPTIFFPEEPGSPNWVQAHSLWAYVTYFVGDSPVRDGDVKRCLLQHGKLYDAALSAEVNLDRDRPVWLYFSHRDDLLTLDQAKWFARDGAGLPLLGPFQVACSSDPELRVDIWRQYDWAVVRAPLVDGKRLDRVKMTDWKENYEIGRSGTLQGGGPGFFAYGNYQQKQRQETWKGGPPIPLIHLGDPNSIPMWVGTLSALPAPKCKLLLVHDSAAGEVYAASYNELEPIGHNRYFPGHHRYNQSLVTTLLSIDRKEKHEALIDALPSPPDRCLLPGDMCWQDQGSTNNCGAFSFSSAMNYWLPYTYNPAEKDGAYCSTTVPDTINGARTPADIITAAGRFRMSGRDNSARDLDKSRALKLVKLWLLAGVPVLILVEEEHGMTSYHWKTFTGYDGRRFFMNNSGGDFETDIDNRISKADYEHAPEGNDVDSESEFWTKWKDAGGDPVALATSVSECTFIPLHPQDAVFSGDQRL